MIVAINMQNAVFSFGGLLNALIFAIFIGYRLFNAAKPLFRQIRAGEWRHWKLNMLIKRR